MGQSKSKRIMFKPITIEEIKERLVFSHDHVFHVVLRLEASNKVFNESFTFSSSYKVVVMDNHDLSWKTLGSTPQQIDEYLISLHKDSEIEVLGFYEYEIE